MLRIKQGQDACKRDLMHFKNAKIKQFKNYILRNFMIYAGRLVLLGQWNPGAYEGIYMETWETQIAYRILMRKSPGKYI
jgi:hypothetical protein